ncbi:uncharacterized protein N0V89_002687 [Didymosphaeria variabile]|uniref:Uncharacterized protein n=1 Tax=Didymosphaeria variabile TaxID=1932322 RepID=A0A9W8XTZ6_9PLEO|nr:uncharacterized protein N0V89_002687 [Didymosphaeria variabile]KAJ4358108.1 hypothetical protein N0V89_002687 [Didymosphaeria variabile]
MAGKPTPPPSCNPLPSSTTSNPAFTPRSSSFPDNIDSDSEDVFDPTPVHSPGGPHYDDLPPSYHEAQQQALHDARNGVLPLDPVQLDLGRLHLDDATPDYEIPSGAEMHAHRATAEELAREGGRSVPVHHVQSSENVPIGRVGSTTSRMPAPLDQSALLDAALQFTRHEPDTDARYAPRLTRCIAIPQNVPNTAAARKGKARARREERRADRRGQSDAHVLGARPGTSTDTLPIASEEPAQFLRAYAKALHAHSIRPAEFLDFLDGLNALCATVGCKPADLIQPSTSSNPNTELVRHYVNASNEAFFAPRGLKISLRSFASLLATAQIPEERGQRAGAVAGAFDPCATPAKRAQALHPWVEALETTVNEPSIAAVTLKEMGEKFKNIAPSLSVATTNRGAHIPETEKTRLEREYAERDRGAAAADDDDPPHSIPGEFPHSNEGPHSPSGGWRGRGGRRGRGDPGSPFGPPGYGPFGPPGHTPFGPPGHGVYGPPGFGPHGPRGFGPFGRGDFGPGRGSWGPRGGPGAGGNSWEALGQSIGKWGEEFGKRMEAWGDQFGKETAAWGNDFGKQFSGGGTGCGTAGPSTQGAATASFSSRLHGAETATRDAQETGVHREESSTPADSHFAIELEKQAAKKATQKHDDDDASSFSSDSSSDSESDDDDDDENDEKAYMNASRHFTNRIREINATADASRAKGKKAPAAIECERAAAIEKAAKDKAAVEEWIDQKRTKRAVMREFKHQRRDMKRDHRQTRKELKRKGLGKKSKEWKEQKKRHQEKKKGLRHEKNDVRRQFREARKTDRSERRGKAAVETGYDASEAVWVLVENLA